MVSAEKLDAYDYSFICINTNLKTESAGGTLRFESDLSRERGFFLNTASYFSAACSCSKSAMSFA